MLGKGLGGLGFFLATPISGQVLANTDALIGADYFNFESMKNKSVAATWTRGPRGEPERALARSALRSEAAYLTNWADPSAGQVWRWGQCQHRQHSGGEHRDLQQDLHEGLAGRQG